MNKHDIELPPLVGTLADLPDRHREVIEAYGQACARVAVEQAEAYADARVREALEEAAQACEARIGQHAPGMTPEDVEDCDEEARLCAAAIRALIPSTPA